MSVAVKPITYTAQIEEMAVKALLTFPFKDKESVRAMLFGSIKEKYPERVYRSFAFAEELHVLRLK